ncbi:hypothetical protein B1C78_05925 [Thioalkalivibrio denitrificans]|uniref:DUF2066 domain-containing protein n=2 Tax=Thioalkalivibrio denitrificans TaxID=108003 RepID=A0A1V3NLG1_9GAMM|nr:hypothetical protein B1C78_05925 [Thioalkalivibrio denitrificans]
MSRPQNPRPLLSHLLVWCVAACLVAGSLGGLALADDRLYEATVTVENRDRPARQAGFERAFEKVLVKLSGDRQVLEDPRVEDLRGQAGRYVQRFRYVDVPDDGVGLEVRFDGAALERLLTDQGLPLWGAQRPGVMIWLGAVHDGRRVILGGEEGRSLMEELERVAEARGIQLIFPVMDLEDRAAVDFADLAGGFHEPVLRASERYSARYVAAVHLQPRGDAWSGRWRLLGQDLREDVRAEGPTVEDVLDEGLQSLVDVLGRRLAIAGLLPGDDHVQVIVDGINDMEDYQRVREYLSGLSVVAELRPYQVEPERAVFVTRLRGSPRDLERGVSLGRVLEPSETGADTPEPGTLARVNLRLSR